MKKTIAMLLAVIMIMSMCVSLSACGNNKNDYVGVWKKPSGYYDYKGDIIYNYMYIYKDGTGDFYHNGSHGSPFTWEVEDDYLVITDSNINGGTIIKKYTLSGNQLLDKQGKVYATKYSSDTSVDVSLD